MIRPRRVQMSRQHPWRANHPDAVAVARPSKWGNPFRPIRCDLLRHDDSLIDIAGRHWHVADGERILALRWVEKQRAVEQAVRCFRIRLANPRLYQRADIAAELAGRDLACWCPLDQPCHADVLLEVANRDL